jgi:hypothetical protein
MAFFPLNHSSGHVGLLVEDPNEQVTSFKILEPKENLVGHVPSAICDGQQKREGLGLYLLRTNVPVLSLFSKMRNQNNSSYRSGRREL